MQTVLRGCHGGRIWDTEVQQCNLSGSPFISCKHQHSAKSLESEWWMVLACNEPA